MSGRNFRLALFGFSETERRVMTSILRLASARGRQYSVVAGRERSHAEVAIVDAERHEAVREWQQILRGDGTPIPVLRVLGNPEGLGAGRIGIRRPITVKRLLEGLDAVLLQDYRYVPELSIHDNGDTADAGGNALAHAAKAALVTERTGHRALVVDDSAPVRKLMGIELGLFGIETEFAESGEAALKCLAGNQFDIVFLDLTLPGMDGHAVCKAIRRSREHKGVRVVMLTGRDSRIDRIRGAMAGCSDYLTKPVAQEDLHRTLRHLLPKEDFHGHHQSAGG